MPELKRLAERLEGLSFSPEQRAWLRDLLACMRGTPPTEEPREEEYEVFPCSACGERFFFQRKAYGSEDHLLCPECGKDYPLPPKGRG
jgi:DNA-directed RNA polymerase subunit RPC12/RpoP